MSDHGIRDERVLERDDLHVLLELVVPVVLLLVVLVLELVLGGGGTFL